MTKDIVQALFLLANIEVTNLYEIANDYWPDHTDYADVRRNHPWWLVKTNYGLIKIGWRKRVIQIDWSDTRIRQEVTKDNVTSSNEIVHAWTYAKAVEYLTALAELFSEQSRRESLPEAKA
jgi:hypothetical protein